MIIYRYRYYFWYKCWTSQFSVALDPWTIEGFKCLPIVEKRQVGCLIIKFQFETIDLIWFDGHLMAISPFLDDWLGVNLPFQDPNNQAVSAIFQRCTGLDPWSWLQLIARLTDGLLLRQCVRRSHSTGHQVAVYMDNPKSPKNLGPCTSKLREHRS